MRCEHHARTYGVMNPTLQIVFRLVAVAKLAYAASACWGFCVAADRHRLDAVIRRGIRSVDQTSVKELIDDADHSLFSQNHVLHQLLAARRNTGYDLRRRLYITIVYYTEI